MALQGHIIVDTEALTTQANVVKRELDNMRQQFERLQNLINGTAQYWIGEAGDKHRNLYKGKQGAIEDMLARYQEHITDLEQMAGIYRQGEDAAMRTGEGLPGSTL